MPRHPLLIVAVVVSLGSRLAAPVDMLFEHDAIGRQGFLLWTWTLGIGLPLFGTAAALLVRMRLGRRPDGGEPRLG